MVRSASGSDITPQAMALMDVLTDHLDNVIEHAETGFTSDQPPVDTALSHELSKDGWSSNDSLRRTLEWFKLDFEYGETPDQISVKHSCA